MNARRWAAGILAGWLLQGGCVGLAQRELEVLFAPTSNPTLVRDSWLYNQFGPSIWNLLKFW